MKPLLVQFAERRIQTLMCLARAGKLASIGIGFTRLPFIEAFIVIRNDETIELRLNPAVLPHA